MPVDNSPGIFLIMPGSQYVNIGHFSRTHGLKGGLVLNFSHGAIEGSPVEIYVRHADEYEALRVKSFSSRPDMAFVQVENIDSVDEARRLKGHAVFLLSREGVAGTEFLPDELVGMEVRDLNSDFSAIVVRVSDDGNRRFLLLSHEGREIILPFEKPFISVRCCR